jgi:pSer/pThr/pTyr-binding forkhead associated (FHA) protein
VRLAPGATIVGRDPGAGVLIDAPSVSRQHARICIDAGRIVVEDLGSKNGTRAGQRDVTSAQEVANGEVLRFGSVAVTLRVRMPDPTRTESDSQ